MPKRALETEEVVDAVESDSDSADAPTADASSDRRSGGKRRATYHVRRDEIVVLQKRMRELEFELKALKYQALLSQTTSGPTGVAAAAASANGGNAESASPVLPRAVAAALPPIPSPLLVPGGRNSALAKSAYTNQILHDAIQTQQFELAGLQALVSQYSMLQNSSPAHTPIRLGRDLALRHEQLVAARERVLLQSNRFVARRSAGMDISKLYTEQERFESDTGDFTAVGFDVVPLGPGAASVRRVFDTLFFQIRHIEITFSEMMGHIAIRENDDTGDAWLSQHRVVASITDDVKIETNAVVYADFEHGRCSEAADSGGGEHRAGDDDFGIIVIEWIDDDELYPYRPTERARRDTTCIFTVRSHSRRRRGGTSTPATARAPSGGGDEDCKEGEDERVVVLTRWSQTKLHKPLVHQDDLRAMLEMRASIGAWGDRIVQAMYESSAAVRSGSVATSAEAAERSSSSCRSSSSSQEEG